LVGGIVAAGAGLAIIRARRLDVQSAGPAKRSAHRRRPRRGARTFRIFPWQGRECGYNSGAFKLALQL